MCKATGTCILLFYSGLMMGLSSCRSNESATMTISDTSNLEHSSTIEPLLNVTGYSKFQSISKQQNPETLSDISTTSHDSETTPVKKVNVTTSIAHLITTLTSTNASTTNTMKNGKVIGIIIFVVLLVIIIISLIIYLRRNRYSFDLHNKVPEDADIPLSNAKE